MNKYCLTMALAGTLGLAGCEETSGELETAEEPAQGQEVATGERVGAAEGAEGAEGEQQARRADDEIGDPSAVQPVAGQQGQQGQPPQNLAPGEIVGALEVINESEISAAELASERAESSDVRDFAQRMIQDHTRSREQLTSITSESDVQSQQGQVTERLRRESEQLMSQLRQQQGAEFDRAYMQAQVRQHQEAVALLDANMDRVDDQQLSRFLQEQRRIIDEHRQMAERIEQSAGSMAAGQARTGQ